MGTYNPCWPLCPSGTTQKCNTSEFFSSYRLQDSKCTLFDRVKSQVHFVSIIFLMLYTGVYINAGVPLRGLKPQHCDITLRMDEYCTASKRMNQSNINQPNYKLNVRHD
jgi:hypothetical protein